MYAVVEFDGRKKEYSVVPHSWLFNDYKECYWPRVRSNASLSNLIEKGQSPDKKKWKQVKLRRLVIIAGRCTNINLYCFFLAMNFYINCSDGRKNIQ